MRKDGALDRIRSTKRRAGTADASSSRAGAPTKAQIVRGEAVMLKWVWQWLARIAKPRMSNEWLREHERSVRA